MAPPSYIIKVIDANGTRTVKTVHGGSNLIGAAGEA